MPRSGLEDKNPLRELLLSFPQKACSCVSFGMQFRHKGSMVGPRSSMFGNGLLPVALFPSHLCNAVVQVRSKPSRMYEVFKISN
jgi:hypothetical protein